MDQKTPRTIWSLQDAKNRFSEVVNAARKQPQSITKHGKEAVVILDAEEYKRLKRVERKKKPTLNDLLLAIPQGDEDIFPPMRVKFRDVDF